MNYGFERHLHKRNPEQKVTMTVPGEVDLVVLGSGAGGMTAALAASVLGLKVVLIEKTDRIGGTSALSAGSVWAPNSRHSPAGNDTPEQALTYLRGAVGNSLDEERIGAFLRAAPAMIELLEDNTPVKFRACEYHPDYAASLEGATVSGRVLEPLPFDASVLGERFDDIRSPLPEFMLFGGMMVDRTDIRCLLAALRRPSAFRHAMRLLVRYARDRLSHGRGTRLVMGNALVARLYHALCERGVHVLLSVEVTSLLQAGGKIAGVTATVAGDAVTIRSRAGVVLATGGLSHHPRLRSALMPASIGAASPVVESATGDGLSLAEGVGGHLGAAHASNGFWAPMSRRRRADGSTAAYPHFLLDRGKPGALAVDPAGRRFVNEATTYHLFGEALFETLRSFPGRSCFLICDDAFIRKYGLGMIRPGPFNRRGVVKDGYLTSAATLETLAARLQLPAANLTATVAGHNEFAETGIDLDFGKGEDAYQRNLGDDSHGPNPCIGTMTQPPFHAVEIYPGDIGASAGLATDSSARVLDAGGRPIDGLYACGNDMESVMAGRYPGPGITLGPGMTFGFVAASHAREASLAARDSETGAEVD